MRALRRLVVRLFGLFGGETGERDFDAEIESHLAMHVEDNLRAGMSVVEARRQAILKLGGMEQVRQAQREGRTVALVENLLQDLRFAARQLCKNKGFAVTAILILSLGICANVAIFSFVDAVMIKPLPYAAPSRLVGLYESTPLGPQFHLSYLDYLDWKKTNKSFTAVEAYAGRNSLMNTPAGLQPVDGILVSDGFLRALGVTPILGRDFLPNDDLPAAPRTVMLSYSAWQNQFGGRLDVLGQTVTLDGNPQEIVGVLPKGFFFAPAGPAAFWGTLRMSSTSDRGLHGLNAIGRLKDGVSLAAASVEMSSIAQQLAKQYPDADEGRGATVMPLAEVIVGNLRPILLLLFSGAGLLLLIACINVSSLLLVRTESRRREIAVRGALGASRVRLMRQFVTEGVLLVSCGTAFGLAGAYWMMQVLTRLIPKNMLVNLPYLNGLGLNYHTIAFAGLVAAFCGFLFSLAPMIRLPLAGLQAGLAEGGRGSAGLTWKRMGANLVIAELCTAMVLLVGAGLLGKSFYRLMHTDLGMEPSRLAMLLVRTTRAAYADDTQVAQMSQELMQTARQLPGVESVAISQGLPVGSGAGNATTFEIMGSPGHPEDNIATIKGASASYFSTLKGRLLQGRYFADEEDKTKPYVAIVNKSFARAYFPGKDPIHQQIRYDASEPWVAIVGVVEDIKEGALDAPVRPLLYVPFLQEPQSTFFLVARTAGDPRAILATLTESVHRAAPRALTSGAETMDEHIHESQVAYLHRSSAWLVGGFAGIALLLGVVGIYGVVAYSVSQRTREIGVRMAMGAQRSQVSSLILREAGWLVAAGVLLGALCSIGAAHLMGTLLFGVSAWDVPTLLAVAAVLSSAALLASFVPATRAAKVDPMVALRAE